MIPLTVDWLKWRNTNCALFHSRINFTRHYFLSERILKLKWVKKIFCDFQQNLINQVKGVIHFISNDIRMLNSVCDAWCCTMNLNYHQIKRTTNIFKHNQHKLNIWTLNIFIKHTHTHTHTRPCTVCIVHASFVGMQIEFNHMTYFAFEFRTIHDSEYV